MQRVAGEDSDLGEGAEGPGQPYLMCGDQANCGLVIKAASQRALRLIYRSLEREKKQSAEIKQLRFLISKKAKANEPDSATEIDRGSEKKSERETDDGFNLEF